MITFFLEKSNTQRKIKVIHIIDTELYLHDCNLYCDKDFFKGLKNRGSVVMWSKHMCFGI